VSGSILFIGTGAGGSSGSTRWRASTLVELADAIFLVDCGVGCHYRLSDRGVLPDIDLVYVTHMHMDHFLGLPELIFQAHMEGRKDPLKIVGPEGIAEAIRAVGPHLFSDINFPLQIETTSNGKTIMLGRAKLQVMEACHLVPSYGLKVSQGDISIGFSSDTLEPCPGLALMKGTKILIHEATCDDSYTELCRKYGHSTARQAIETSLKFDSEVALLNHIDERFHNVNATVKNLLKASEKPLARIVNDLDKVLLK